MHNGHLRDGIGNDDRDDGTEKIREDDAGASQPNGDRTAKEEADADGATDGHHGELALREPALELVRALLSSLDRCHAAPFRTRESPRGCCSGRSMRG